MVLAWENLWRFLWCWSSFCCCCCSLHLSFFFTHIFFSTSSLTLPWTIARFLDPFCTFSPAHHRVIRNTFIFQPFSYLFTASATVLSGHFLPTGVFYLMLLPNIFGTFPTFWHNLLLSSFHWELAVTFLKIAGLYTDPQKTDLAHLFVWFTVIHNLLYILSLYLLYILNMYCLHVNIAKVLLVVKTLIRSVAILFSSHENVKQQPN